MWLLDRDDVGQRAHEEAGGAKGANRMIPSRAVARWTAYLAVIYIMTRLPEAAGIAATENPAQSVNSAAKVALIPVRLPLTGNADQRVMASAEKAVKSLQASTPGDKRGIAIFEF